MVLTDTSIRRAMMITGLVLGTWLLLTSLNVFLGLRTIAARRASDVELVATMRDEGFNMLLGGVLGAAVVAAGTLVAMRLSRLRERLEVETAERQQLLVLARMSAVLAHELRNPLASAKGHSQLLEEMLKEDARARLKAQYVVQELLRLEGLTDRLISFARAGHIQKQPRDPVVLARSAIAAVQTSVPVELHSEGAPTEWLLDGNAMEQVLVNLLRNAQQAQGALSEAAISVTLGLRAGNLDIRVRDHGPGLQGGVELFTPFVTTKASGVGLGLALCRQIVKAHGGDIVLRNHPEGGALVEIVLPPDRANPLKDAMQVGAGR